MAADPLVVTRPRAKAESARAIAREHGFTPLLAPTLAIHPHEDPAYETVLDALEAGTLDALVFTGSTGVTHAWRQAGDAGHELASLLEDTRVVPIGPRTADALRERDVPVHTVPATHSSEGLVDWFQAHADPGWRVAVVRSTRGTPVLPEGLRQQGLDILEAHVYDLARPAPTDAHERALERTRAGDVAGWTFTSRLTVEHAFAIADALGVDADDLATWLEAVPVGAIGEPTRRALAKRGVTADVVPDEARFEALVGGLGETPPRQ